MTTLTPFSTSKDAKAWIDSIRFDKNMLKQMIAIQQETMAINYPDIHVTNYKHSPETIRNQFLYAHTELSECLQNLDFKDHRTGLTKLHEAKKEYVDVLKFILNIGVILGFTHTSLMAMFTKKSKIVFERMLDKPE